MKNIGLKVLEAIKRYSLLIHRNLSGIYLRSVLNLIPLIHITSILPIEITGVTSMSIQMI
jgi:hypothetical protein